ncbi:hypothetical protein SAMN05880501_12313 [Ureibacillus xyleni]|uniref:Uncharacterized protein n=1 Tax=Ureibacillus xyleni TaxID=614648 RepID=A0A285TY42_9BACL|nr:hypothetical protein SAMN05880501_12313 [Ureibacillus xyleni]
MEILTGKVVTISFFLLIVTMIETLAYSTRISGKMLLILYSS